jgi:hypothetical protein
MNLGIRKIMIGLVIGLSIGGMLFYISRSFYDYWQFKKELRQNVIYWKSIAGEYPNYPDSWVKLAINWYKLGEDKFAQLAIEKAERLDPINDNIKNIKKEIVNRN